ncbi:DUF1566 domain-containing protein [Myxococcus sp. AM009]|uniref:CARDB domain-containing protein n=1 Tax=Myxococcus sp. AM009 TaxID=2745137 RepID=UPI001595825B|nr:CARDB domain-containing protein [Myxococcus sp. AM009]NVJ00069.1 DUF1566 domain-containing protein [Myxococcus sp. AM009]
MSDYVKDYNRCASQGFNKPGCSAKDMVWSGLCMVLDWQMSDMLSLDIGIPYGELCLGGATLKCCKYEPATDTSCHSAFNSEAPINCEGNPYYTSAESYGPCLEPEEGSGCFCDYLPQCSSPVVERSGSGDWRFNQFGVMLAAAIEEGADALIRQQPGDFVDYVGFVGTCPHREVILTGAPFSKPDEFPPGYPLNDAYHESDNVPEARYLRGLTTLAIQRVLSGIPNVQSRWNAIASRHWTEPEKTAYLANVSDPEAVLESCVGEFGVDMLRQAYPGEYLLLAAPLQGETEPNCPAGWVGGAAICAAASLSVAVSTSGASVTLVPSVYDPSANYNADGTYAVQLDWGDGLVEGRVYGVSEPSTHAWMHTFEAAGTYTVTARITNTSGLVGETTTQVVVAEGSGQPVRRSVESVQFAMDASVTAYKHGRIRVDVEGLDAEGNVHKLGYHWVTLTGEDWTNVTVPLTSTLSHGGLTDLQSFRLRTNHYEGNAVSLRVLRLWGVTLNLYASPGMSPQSRSYVLTNRDVKVYAPGNPTPTAPLVEPGSGKLELPLMNAEIVIDLPTIPEPAPSWSYGCRPVYGSDAPLMRTANGGCEDIASGLVFAVIPFHSNWHDAVWDSSVPGSAVPDAHDYGRVNDYSGGYPISAGPDASAAAYCHELTQGGFSDWRLPSDKELARVTSASMAGTYFPHAVSEYAWTSTNWSASYAVLIHLLGGGHYGIKATESHRVVCVRSGPPPAEHACRVPADGEQLFVTGCGGCMDTRAGGLVWSRPSVPVKTWHDAVWGAELAGNAQPDADDGARTNDYAGGIVPGVSDASLDNHCHSLVEGGFSDWRLPTVTEIHRVSGSALAKKYFDFETAEYFWSASAYSTSGTLVQSIYLGDGGHSYDETTKYQRVVCVRPPASMIAADLAPIAFIGPAAAATRQTVSLSWTVTNQGSVDATPSWRDAIYLSRDIYPSSNDALVLDASRSTLLAPGGSYTVTKSVDLPGVPAGDYFLLLRVDSTSVVVERDDGNNGWAALPITVTNPDLAITAFSGPSEAAVQQRAPISWTVTNAGTANAYRSWSDFVYLSTDQTFGGGDVNVTSWQHSGGLAPGASYTVANTATLPNVPAGNYFLLLRVDHYGALYESEETNNTWTALPITVTNPDLAATAFSGPSVAEAQESVSFTWTVTNAGTEVAYPNWYDYVYLSTDERYDSGDTSVMSEVRTSALAPGASYTITESAVLPSVPAGNYFLLLRVDRNGVLHEPNEENNTWTALPISLRAADLVPGELSAPPSARAGSSISLAWSVSNGSVDVVAHPSWSDYVYLSKDETCCTGDTSLANESRRTALEPGASYSLTRTVTLPATLTPGVYNLILSVDRNGSLPETNEENNLVVVPFTVDP